MSGAVETYGGSINSAGTVTGFYRFSDNKDHGFIRAPDGTITTFDVTGADETTPRAINVKGSVTGYAIGATMGMGFVRTPDGTITTFQVPGETGGTNPLSINAEGEVTGNYCCIFRNGLALMKGFLRHKNGHFTTFLLTPATYPMRIVPSGAIAGFYVDTSDNYHGFFRDNGGRVIKFDVPGGSGSLTRPLAMNIRDTIVGFYYDGTKDRGFLFKVPKHQFSRFDVPGSAATNPVAINNGGQVTGYYYSSNGGNSKGFVRIP